MKTIACEGFLNDEKAAALKEELEIARNYHRRIALDFEKVTYINSSAIGVIGSYSLHFDQLSVINVNSKVFAVFDIVGLTEIKNMTFTVT